MITLKDEILSVLDRKVETVELPYVGVYEINNILIEINGGEWIDFNSEKNGWDIDWWFNFPLEYNRI